MKYCQVMKMLGIAAAIGAVWMTISMLPDLKRELKLARM